MFALRETLLRSEERGMSEKELRHARDRVLLAFDDPSWEPPRFELKQTHPHRLDLLTFDPHTGEPVKLEVEPSKVTITIHESPPPSSRHPSIPPPAAAAMAVAISLEEQRRLGFLPE